MSPICSKAAMRALISVLLASSVANAAALPHEVLDARAPAAIQNANAEIAAEAIQAAASAVAEDPDNFFEEVSDGLNNRTGWEVFRDFFTRLFGPRTGDHDDDDNSTTTVTVTIAAATPETTTAAASISLTIVLPPGPSGTPSAVISDIPYTTSAPATEVFSILPIGDLTTSINATELTPIFNTAPASDSPIPTVSAIEVPPFPIDNGTTTDVLLPTAVSITGQFSVMIPLITDVPTSATANTTEPVETMVGPGMNTTLPGGTGVPLVTDVSVVVNLTVPIGTLVGPLETELPAVNVTVPVGTGVVSLPPTPANSSAPAGTGLTFLVPIDNATELPANATAALNETASSTTVVVLTETVVPIPVTVTGVDATASAGTGLPIVIVGTPLWPNSTYDEPTGTALPGTAVPLGTGTAVSVLPVETALPINTTVILPIGTGIPLLTGVPEPSVGTALPIAASESPVYPNTTTTTSTSTLVIPIPILVTGVPEPATVNVTIPASPISETVDPLAALTELPLTVTGSPGTVLNINVTIPIAPYANATAPVVVEATAVAPLETVATASVGTGLPIATLAADPAAPFTNTTVPAPTAVVETPAIVILPAPVETTEGQLNVTVSLNAGQNYDG